MKKRCILKLDTIDLMIEGLAHHKWAFKYMHTVNIKADILATMSSAAVKSLFTCPKSKVSNYK